MTTACAKHGNGQMLGPNLSPWCRLFYRGLTGYGILLTWLTLLTALATTSIGGHAASSGSGVAPWLSYAMAALGGLHTLLTVFDARFGLCST